MKNTLLTLITIALFSLGAQTSSAQTSNKAVYVELLGNGVTFSANYDMRFTNKADGIGGRIGIGYVGVEGDGILSIPVMANYLLGKNGKYFEVGLGATFLSSDADIFDSNTSGTVGTMSFMYRRQPTDGGFMWKIGITPLFNKDFFIPYWFGAGLGYAF